MQEVGQGPCWISIEVWDGIRPATVWRNTFGDRLIEQAIVDGASDWRWHQYATGVVLQLEFKTRRSWDEFALSVIARNAFESVPDPVAGLIFHEGQGGAGWKRVPRKPRPLIGAGAAALPLPLETEVFDVYSPITDDRIFRIQTSTN